MNQQMGSFGIVVADAIQISNDNDILRLGITYEPTAYRVDGEGIS